MYYISYLFMGAKLHYTGLEKLTMGLTLTVQRLHSYFLSHPIMVLIDTLLGHILNHLEVTGRLIKWEIEINKYDIEYQPCHAIKSQALTDFLMETVWKEEQELWMVFVDELENNEGSRVGVVLISLQGEETRLVMLL